MPSSEAPAHCCEGGEEMRGPPGAGEAVGRPPGTHGALHPISQALRKEAALLVRGLF